MSSTHYVSMVSMYYLKLLSVTNIKASTATLSVSSLVDTISGLSPTLCEEMISNNIVSKLFTQLCSVNRSVAEATCAKIATKILVNLCKYNKIIVDVWKVSF